MTLTLLRVRDLATVADVTLDLAPGLNVLTGETGAGKSMLVDALALLLGDRADRAAIRPGASRMLIEGVIEPVDAGVRARLDELGIAVESELVIRREVTREGRSRAWINGSPTTIGVLASAGAGLVDLHGQHHTVQLLDGATQRNLLDAFAHAGDAVLDVAAAHTAVTGLRERHARLAAQRDEALRRADWLRHVVAEIDAARIVPGEEESLERDLRRLAQAGTLAEFSATVGDALESDASGVRAALGRVERALHALERVDPDTSSWRELLDPAFLAIDELSRRVADYAGDIAEDPARLADLDRRRALLSDLRRKHGATLAAVLDTGRAARDELAILDTADLELRSLDAQSIAAHGVLVRSAERLTALRVDAAARLAREVTRGLPRLGLGDAAFSVELAPTEPISAGGAESANFLVRLNPGMDARPLARAASGGELSRVMLALKVVLARQDAVPTLVFDEIDQGVGGEIGARIGDALARVAERHQVLVITHLPQIAARADRHLRVAKTTRDGMATSDVTVLHGEDRVLELARMLGGQGDAERRLAQELLRDRINA